MSLRYVTVIAALMTLSGCGDSPAPDRTGTIQVEAGNDRAGAAQTSGAVSTSGALFEPVATVQVPFAQATPVRELSVAESALINTPEMWSEPIQNKD